MDEPTRSSLQMIFNFYPKHRHPTPHSIIKTLIIPLQGKLPQRTLLFGSTTQNKMLIEEKSPL